MSDTNDQLSSLNSLMSNIKSAASPFRTYLQDVHREFKDNHDGAVADYIPELAKADPNDFGISIVTVTGSVFEVGNCDRKFTIQSVSKAFMYGLALEDLGREKAL